MFLIWFLKQFDVVMENEGENQESFSIFVEDQKVFVISQILDCIV